MKSIKLQLLVTLAAVLTVAAILVIKGLPPNVGSSAGMPDIDFILTKAARDGDLAQVRRALNWGAHVDALDGEGRTPMSAAIEVDTREMVELLLAHGANVDRALVDAVEAMKKDMVELLLAHGANINVQGNIYGETMLHGAARGGFQNMAEMLIAHGADVNIRDESGQTPLHIAAIYGRQDIAKLLVAHGADLSVKTNQGGWTPLHTAISTGHDDMAEFLRQHGAKE